MKRRLFAATSVIAPLAAAQSDSLQTPLTRLLRIRYPIVQAGMGGVATPELVAAVSNAGGLGILAGVLTPPDDLRQKIRRIRELTKQPFGVNLLLHEHLRPPRDPALIPAGDLAKVHGVLNQFRRKLGLPEKQGAPPRVPAFTDKAIDVLVEERIPVFSIGLGNPSQDLVSRFRAQGTKVMAMICTVEDARAVVASGVDLIAAQGAEAGGHRSTWVKRSKEEAAIGAMTLVQSLVSEFKLPVLAAGAIMNGRDLLAALSLGAAGVLMGTRFIPTRESGAPPAYKKAILERSGSETTLTDAFTGMYARVLRNEFSETFEKSGNPALPPFSHYLAGADVNAAAMKADDTRYYPLYAGQGAGRVRSIDGAGDVVTAMVKEANDGLQALRKQLGR